MNRPTSSRGFFVLRLSVRVYGNARRVGGTECVSVAAKPNSHSDKTRPRLRAAGWGLLALSLLLGIGGPRMTASNLPADIGNRMGDINLASLGWIIVAMIVGALALMCFIAQWVLRPREDNAQHPENPQSK